MCLIAISCFFQYGEGCCANVKSNVGKACTDVYFIYYEPDYVQDSSGFLDGLLGGDDIDDTTLYIILGGAAVCLLAAFLCLCCCCCGEEEEEETK